MPPLPLQTSTSRLIGQLQAAQTTVPHNGQTFHVASLGAGFYFAYEQLRNVAEYREHHLLLRSAIERYLHRDGNLSNIQPLAAELVTELTQAGYLKNDTIPLATLEHIDRALAAHAALYHNLTTHHIASPTATKWLFQYASVQIENLVAPDPKTNIVMTYTYEHYLESIDAGAAQHTTSDDQTYRIALFCAVQRALFKSNLATIRYYCVNASLGQLDNQPLAHIIALNQLIDNLYQTPITNHLTRLVTRYGAPMRIIRDFILDGDSATHLLVAGRDATLSRIKALAAAAYAATEKQLGVRIGRTILFILITKTLIGVSIEIPYDLSTAGVIGWTPLLINIFFPLIYLYTITLSIHTPGRQNTDVIASYADRILFDGAGPAVVYQPKRRVKSKSLNAAFNIVYAVGFIGSISLLVWALHRFGFGAINGTIFFIFFSAVSFLGFRLRQLSRELQMIDERQGLLQTLADFLSTPFVRMGHWLSDKYARANIVTFVLDLAIEMPLKTSLRFIRQWISFMRDKQEEL